MNTPAPCILYRPLRGTPTDDPELAGMLEAGFEVFSSRNNPAIQNRTVIGRYSVLPFYQELEQDLKWQRSPLVNTYRQHRFIADVRNYAEILGDLTPRTWDRLQDIPSNKTGPFVCKGVTNSRKDVPWRKGMFAPTVQDLRSVLAFLESDSFIAGQGIVIREYVPLVTYMEGVTGQPITNEWRVFIYRGKVLASGYYWASYDDETRDFRPLTLPEEARGCVEEAIRRIGNRAPFVVIDVAEKQSGGWIVVELNDGQMSGLSCIDPVEFYQALYNAMSET